MATAIAEVVPEKTVKRLKVDPAEAVVKLQRTFRRVARKLVRRDIHLRSDVRQEMSLTTLRCQKPHTLAWFQLRAYWHAYDYVRRVIERKERLVGNVKRFKNKLISDKQHAFERLLMRAEG